ncbi:MAG: hypothetical protein JXB48_21960 [Candidatus Latescibacteria bacterium]|nr:hypothetical protein [Candidatus Latescibacterota bacterium]
MAKEKDKDKKNEEVTDYESLLDDFSNIFDESEDESEDESNEAQVDHDGLALSELLGEDVTVSKKTREVTADTSPGDDEISDVANELVDLDLEEYSVSETKVDSDGEEIFVDTGSEKTDLEDHEIDDLAEAYSGGFDRNDHEITFSSDEITQTLERLDLDDQDETGPETEEVEFPESVSETEPKNVEIELSEEESDAEVTREVQALNFDDLPDTEEVAEITQKVEEIAEDEADTGDFKELEDFDFGDIIEEESSAGEETKDEDVTDNKDGEITQEIEALDLDDLSDLDIGDEEMQPEENISDEVESDLNSPSEIILDEVTDEVGGYASLLDQLNADKTDEIIADLDVRSDKEEGLFSEDDDISELSFDTIELPGDVSAEEETDDESAFIDLGLELEDENEGEYESEEKHAVSIAEPDSGEEDFLGLSGISAGEGSASGGMGAAAEILFDGIEMDFDDQISLVTRAEILLAQKKKEEAAELFRQVADEKGETHWVTKRLRLLGSQVPKTDN